MPKQKTSNSTKTVTILDTETPTPTPIEKQQEFEYKYFKLDTSKLVSLIKKDLQATNEGSAFLSQYNKEDIMRYLQSPVASEKIIRQISNLLYNLSPQYKRILKYFVDMTRFDYVLDMNSLKLIELPKKEVLEKYLKTGKYLETMNIKHEFNKITNTCFIEDTFFGYIYSTNHSYIIQKLDPNYCRVNGWADGVRTFQFSFDFFNNTKNKELLETYYAPEFKEKYELYKENGRDYKWQELSLDRTICIKLNETLEYSVPFFANIFPDLFDLSDYKLLRKMREEMNNYVILVAKIPYLSKSDTANAFALHMDDAITYGNKAISSLPEGVGFILSPYDEVTDIHLGNTNQMDNNAVEDAEKSLFNAVGINDSLFNSDKISEESIRKSIQSDENIVFSLYRQFERWTNRTLKLNLDDNFKIRIINSTEYNHEELAKEFKEASQYGLPFVNEWGAVLGKSPLEFYMSLHLQNNIFDYENSLIPVKSSNTMSPDKVNGRTPQDASGGGDTGKKLPKENE